MKLTADLSDNNVRTTYWRMVNLMQRMI